MIRRNEMQGRYQQQLRRVFSLIALLTSLLVIGLGSLWYAQLRKNESQGKHLAAMSQMQYINAGFFSIQSALETLRSSAELEHWVESKDNPSYYFSSIALWEKIKAATSPLGTLDFAFAVTSDHLNGLVISPNGTISRDAYFQQETTLDPSQQQRIASFSHKPYQTPLLIPTYDEQGTLNELYWVTSVGSPSADPIIICKIIVSTLFPLSQGVDFGIMQQDGTMIAGMQDKQTVQALHLLATQPSATLFRSGIYGQSEQIPGTPWRLLLVFSSPLAGIGWPLWILLAVFVASLLSFLLSFQKTAKKLYQPIEQVIQEQGTSSHDGIVDEFAMIRNNGKRISQLSQELEEAATIQASLRMQHDALSLLEGVQDTRYHDDETAYRVACIELDDTPESPFLSFQIEAETSTDPSLLFVRFTNTLIVLIFSEPDKDIVMQKLRLLLVPSQLQASLSEPVIGKNALGTAFSQAQRILEYRHTHPTTQILSLEDVDSLDENQYHYPLSLEKQFLQAMLLGTGQVEVAIEEIKEENFHIRTLSRQGRQNLTYAVAGTIGRALQELKTSTEELYGTATDWSAIYGAARDEQTLEILFHIARNITEAIRNQRMNNDRKMLAMMRSYIEKNYNRDIMLQDMADQFNITAKYCGKLFAELSNDTFKNYLNQYRITVAEEKIRENPHVKINDLAPRVGFNSATSFIRVFNRYVGMSPKAFADRISHPEGETHAQSLDQ